MVATFQARLFLAQRTAHTALRHQLAHAPGTQAAASVSAGLELEGPRVKDPVRPVWSTLINKKQNSGKL